MSAAAWGMPSLWLLYALIMPLGLALLVKGAVFGMEAVLLWCVVAVSATRLSRIAFTGPSRLITMTFWVYVYIFLGLTPFLQVLAGRFPHSGRYSFETILTAVTLILAGAACFEIGNRTVSPDFARRFANNLLLVHRTVRMRPAVLYALAAIVGTPLLIYLIGGLEFLFLPRYERAAYIYEVVGGEGETRGQVLNALLRTPTYVAFLVLFAIWRFARRRGESLPLWLVGLMAVAGTLTLIINNPIATSRFWLGTIVLSVLIAAVRWNTRSFAALTLFLTAGFIAVFPFADLFRHTLEVSLGERLEAVSVTRELVESGNFDSFQQILNVLNYVGDRGFTWGYQLLGTLLFWFPRSIWTDKPLPTGNLIAYYANYDFANLSLPLWGELYIDGGVILVCAGFLLYGAVVRAIESGWMMKTDRLTLAPLIAVFFAGYQFFFLRGALLVAFAYAVPVLLSLWFCTSKWPFHFRSTDPASVRPA